MRSKREHGRGMLIMPVSTSLISFTFRPDLIGNVRYVEVEVARFGSGMESARLTFTFQ